MDPTASALLGRAGWLDCPRLPMDVPESAELLARWRDGDEQAAAAIVERFTERLLALARSQLSERIARRVDAEDVVQSAYRTFFAGARDDRYVLRHSGDLWHLLASITCHKLQHHVARHTAARRSIEREAGFGRESSLLLLGAEVVARAPTPAEAAALVDELEHLLRPLKPLHRRMVEMRLQGHSLEEIAAATERSERLVRRVLDQIKSQLRQRYPEYPLG
jgi:RNA polymerase sigma factor (sigma-70 family)